MKTIIRIAASIELLLGQSLHAHELNIYLRRQPFLIDPFLRVFTEKTGIETKVLYLRKGLAQRLKSEGRNSQANFFLSVDIARLSVCSLIGLLPKTNSETLENKNPVHLRSTDNTWFAMSKRSRINATSKDRVVEGEITRGQDLADPKRTERICRRPGSHLYNLAFMARIIAHDGAKAAEEWGRGLIANCARKPKENDRAQFKAIFEGVCNVALINSYYYEKMKLSKESDPKARVASMNIVYSNQVDADRGAHIDLHDGWIAIHSKNKEAEVNLLEMLSHENSQQPYSEINFEFTSNYFVKPTEEFVSRGAFKEDQLPIETIAKLSRHARITIDRVGC